jgi:hypothetical protein
MSQQHENTLVLRQGIKEELIYLYKKITRCKRCRQAIPLGISIDFSSIRLFRPFLNPFLETTSENELNF